MARARGDDGALLFFGRRATEQGKGDYYQRRAVQGANHPKRSSDDDSDLGELKWAVLTGDLGTLDDMIHDFFDLPVGFRISDIPRRRFWEPVLELDLPPADWRDEYHQKEIFENALESGDIRIMGLSLETGICTSGLEKDILVGVCFSRDNLKMLTPLL
nr:hypothetical protein Cbor_180 [Cedratvirus borely]